MECEHKLEDVFYYPEINEAGWKCVGCNTKLGFRPDFDKRLIYGKIDAILQDLNTGKFIHVSNGVQGQCIVQNVVLECEKKQRFDQYFILLELMKESNIDVKGHSNYWKEEANKVLLKNKTLNYSFGKDGGKHV